MREIKFRAEHNGKVYEFETVIPKRKDHKGYYKMHGYILRRVNNHPFANKRGYVPEHLVAIDPAFGEIKYRLYDRDKNITQIFTLRELISKTFRREKFEFRGRFTGLKDKNGKEIYEGDILQAFDSEDFRMQIVYREPSFYIKWFDETIISVRQTRDGAEPIPHNIHITSAVIGNIYEHPHLMEESGYKRNKEAE